MEVLVTPERSDAGGGVAFPVWQTQRFPGSRLLQQEVRDPKEASPRRKMQQGLLRIHVCGRGRRREMSERTDGSNKDNTVRRRALAPAPYRLGFSSSHKGTGQG